MEERGSGQQVGVASELERPDDNALSRQCSHRGDTPIDPGVDARRKKRSIFHQIGRLMESVFPNLNRLWRQNRSFA
jgi:hypothetical protein